MRGLLLAVAILFAIGCGGGSGGKPGASDPPPADGGEDAATYKAKLAEATPIKIQDFQGSGLKAAEYAADEKYPQFFRFVVLDVPRVYLTDKVTGKGGWYTRARLTLNDPVPVGVGNRRMPEPFAWARVELFP